MICHLHTIRLSRGLSQNELGELVGVKRQAIYHLEAGRYLPNTALALRLAKLLRYNVESFLYYRGTKGMVIAILAPSSFLLLICKSPPRILIQSCTTVNPISCLLMPWIPVAAGSNP